MPLTKTGKKVMAAMMQEYGPEKGKAVFYAKAHEMGRKWHHSPDSYDDTSTNPVPTRKAFHVEQDGRDNPTMKGTPVGGTDSPRVTPVTKQGGYPTTPSGSKKTPAGVDAYTDDAV